MGLNTHQKSVLLAVSLTGAALAAGAHEYLKTNKAAEQINDAARLVLDAQHDLDSGSCTVTTMGNPSCEVFNVACADNTYILMNHIVGDTFGARNYMLRRSLTGGESTNGFNFDQGRTDEDVAAAGKFGFEIPAHSPAFRNSDHIFSLNTFSRATDGYYTSCNTQYPDTDTLSNCFLHPNGPDTTESSVLNRSVFVSQLKDTAAVYFDLYDNVAQLARSQSE